MRLVLSVALVHLVMMSVFIVDLTLRQQNLLLDRQQEGAISLTRILATSSAGWMLFKRMTLPIRYVRERR